MWLNNYTSMNSFLQIIYIYITIRLCHPLLPGGLPGYILCPYRAFVDKYLRVRVKGSIGERRL